MNEQHARPDGHSHGDRYDPAGTPDHSSPTEQFPTAGVPSGQNRRGQFQGDPSPTEQFLPVERDDHQQTQRFGAGPSAPQQYEPGPHSPRMQQPHPYDPQRFADPHRAAPPYGRPELLAHEGGFPYGTPPAAPYGATAPYGHHDQFIPQHLHVPPHQMPQGAYPQHFAPPPMQQTVFVNAGYPAKRVNHVLHLILTLLTAGLWLPVWIILAIANS